MTTLPQSRYQPAGTADGLALLRVLVNDVLDVLQEVAAERRGPVAPGGPAGARAAARAALAGPLLPTEAGDPGQVLADLVRPYARWSVDVTHPAALARLQCPPTGAAVATELVAATLNQSLHAWESGPFALELDRWLIERFAELVGYGPGAGGTLTSGGSVSNLMALLAARDEAVQARLGRYAFDEGLGNLPLRPVVVAPEGIHFSIGRGARVIGVGEGNVVPVPTDRLGRMSAEAADRVLADLPDDALPIALVACAGSTDFGLIDPLRELAEVARRHNVWLHADAAYGGGALFSPRLRSRLDGLAEADSITLDLHKFGWTPASSAVFLVRRAETLNPLSLHPTSCLSSDDDTVAGYLGLQNSSLQTTRRVDSLKIAVTMRTLGAEALAAMVDACHDLARYAAARIAAEPRLESVGEPPLNAVLFRYLPTAGAEADAFNGALRRRLMADGRVLLARTHLRRPDGGSDVYLKLVVLNPDTTNAQLDAVLDEVLAVAAELEAVG